jgi:hypothetical protein
MVEHTVVSRRGLMVAAVGLVCLSLCGLLVSCGGGGTVEPPAGVAVTVSPSLYTLQPGESHTFTAAVTGTTNTAVTWTVQEPGGGTITADGEYTAPATEGTYHVVATSVADATASDSATVTVTSGGGALTNLFFLHHSVGDGLVVEGDMRGAIDAYNTAHGTSFVLWDHGYNSDGLRDPSGTFTGDNYDIPDDNTDVEGYYNLWTSSEAQYVTCRNLILDTHEVIAFKSCFPNSEISDDAMLAQYQTWYLAMRDFFDTRPDRLFVVMSTPPLRQADTTPESAARARAFADWLSSDTYLSGHPNVVCFDLFDCLASPDDGGATANMLRPEYESADSHPNTLANETVGPIFAEFLCNAAAGYTP